ncbi:MAG: hypothetical protein CVU89_07430 [Firmicutes bacterium HGW-Firmicutes-14]|nr:MAG: hypothetical protein CVU89_07430 [Firmicutes bacterium HGW-Firmicutes-14]
MDGQKNNFGIFSESDCEGSYTKESCGEDILITPKIINAFLRNHGLNKELRAKHLFAFGIGTVITGFFTQWNIGLGPAGPYGLFAAMLIVSWIYLTFFSVLARFSVNYPYAGGPYAYTRLGLGTFGGYLAGAATTLQFVSASALVLMIARKFVSSIYPQMPGDYLVLSMFVFLLIIHLSGIWVSGIVQIFLTGTALSGIGLFFIGGYHAPHINNFVTDPVVFGGWQGILAAMPAVMWLYLGMEGITMSAEETRKPQRDLPLSLMTGMGFAFLLSLGVIYVGAFYTDWSLLKTVNFPLLFILSKVQSEDKVLLATFGLINLGVFFTSLHGLINGYSRQVYALSRAGYLPNYLSRMRTKHQTPFPAVIIPGLFSVIICFAASFQTVTVLTLFSAMLMYLLVIISYLRIIKSKPKIFSKSRALLCHPFVLLVNLGLLVMGQISLMYQYFTSVWVILAVYSGVFLYYYFRAGKHIRDEAPEETAAISMQNKVRIEVK